MATSAFCCFLGLLTLSLHFTKGARHNLAAENREYWNKLAKEDLDAAVSNNFDKSKVAKNVVMFLGDGMGPATVTAARIYMGQLQGNPGEEGYLSFDRFPNVALLKTYNTNAQVSDSAGTATAYLGGVKTRIGAIGVTQDVSSCSNYKKEHNVLSILRRSAAAGKSVGLLTNTRITHATPSAAYAHTPSRMWEDDSARNKDVQDENLRKQCPDIAQQLVDNAIDFRWIMGGGAAKFLPKSKGGSRSDGQDLIEEWKKRQKTKGRRFKVLRNKTEFDAFDPSSADYVLGLMSPSQMPYTILKDKNAIPLADMTEKAMKLLSGNPKGYLLFVEGGLIDQGHHSNQAHLALAEVVNMDRAVAKALELQDKSTTLTIVTADHSHTFTLAGGFPSRGRSLFDISDWPEWGSPQKPGYARDGMPYTSMGYANGPSALGLPRGGKARKLISKQDLANPNYKFPASIPLKVETHGGEDVALYARGPGSWLFHSTHEQNYVAHAVMSASCVGFYDKTTKCLKRNSAQLLRTHFLKNSNWILVIVVMHLWLH